MTPEMNSASHHLERGLWVVLASPFADGTLDLASLERQLDLAASVGADGVVALGVFGEADTLTSREQRDVVRTVAATPLPYVVGLPARTTEVAVEQTEVVLDGVDRAPRAVMVQVSSPRADVLATHLETVHRRTGLPLVLQDYPAVSHVSVPAPVLAEVASAASAYVAAVKAESSPTSPAIAELVARVDAPVFGGLGGVGLIDELACGAAGAMTGMSHPEALRAALDAWEVGGFAAVRATWGPWLPLVNFEGQLRIGLAIRKEVLRRRGVLASAEVRPPSATLPPALVPVLDEHLAHLPTLQPTR